MEPPAEPVAEESVASNSADAIGDAYEATKAPVKKSVKRAAKKPVKAAKKPDVTKEVKKLSKHIGLIEGEVSEITKRYEELKSQKQEQVEEPSEDESVQVKTDDQMKIEKFAKMLKTLNTFKTEYKTAKNTVDKKQIHNKISDFTQKWLDAKNL